MKDRLRRISSTILLATVASLASCGFEARRLDAQMEELCKKDGGTKVYEQVTLPASDFSNVGQPLARYARLAKTREEYLGPDYKYVEKKAFIFGPQANVQNGEGQLTRWHHAIIRRSDGRLLGESVLYDRSGGDGFTFGFQPSGNSCPKPRLDLALSIFVKEK